MQIAIRIGWEGGALARRNLSRQFVEAMAVGMAIEDAVSRAGRGGLKRRPPSQG